MKLTSEKTWKHCLAMWKWIAKQENSNGLRVIFLKKKWLKNNGFEAEKISAYCFFCEYDNSHKGRGCDNCPGRKVDPDFDCTDTKYDYYHKPVLFYEKLCSLNRKRKKAKKQGSKLPK